MYQSVIAQIDKIEPIEGRDRIVKASVCGSWVIVGSDMKVGELVLYFPVDGCVSQEYGEKHDLFRRKDADGKNIGGYLEANGRIRPIRFGGVKSDGLVMPIDSIFYTGKTMFTRGELIDTIGDHVICTKYVNPATKVQQQHGKRLRQETIMFQKHMDTEQLMIRLNDLEKGDFLVVTQKLHGTSQRVGCVLRDRGWFAKLLLRFGRDLQKREFLVGTRNVILTDGKSDTWYSREFREKAAAPFKDKLHKGELVYYEVVGREPHKAPIMGAVSIDELDEDKKEQYKNNYGIQTFGQLVYTYGLPAGELEVYVYRIALVNSDGHMIDYSWDDVKRRCKELGVKYVPELKVGQFDGDHRSFADNIVDAYENEDDFIDPTHPLEGIVVRKEGGLKPAFYKWKTYNFKLLEGIIKTQEDYVDTEEAS